MEHIRTNPNDSIVSWRHSGFGPHNAIGSCCHTEGPPAWQPPTPSSTCNPFLFFSLLWRHHWRHLSSYQAFLPSNIFASGLIQSIPFVRVRPAPVRHRVARMLHGKFNYPRQAIHQDIGVGLEPDADDVPF